MESHRAFHSFFFSPLLYTRAIQEPSHHILQLLLIPTKNIRFAYPTSPQLGGWKLSACLSVYLSLFHIPFFLFPPSRPFSFLPLTSIAFIQKQCKQMASKPRKRRVVTANRTTPGIQKAHWASVITAERKPRRHLLVPPSLDGRERGSPYKDLCSAKEKKLIVLTNSRVYGDKYQKKARTVILPLLKQRNC